METTSIVRPLVLALVTCTAGWLGAVAPPAEIRWLPDAPVTTSSAQPDHTATCPPLTVPDGTICVHVPLEESGDLPEGLPSQNLHRERSGRWAVYDQIPRRPERPVAYEAYRYPIPAGMPEGKSVISGYDLDLPDERQRRGRHLRAVGHGAVDLPQERGTPVRLVALEHQRGDADVVYAGPLFGTTVVTRHALREGGQLREYLVLYGHLEAVAPGVAVGATVRDGDVVGFVGDTGSPHLVHLHLEVRRVRDGVDVMQRGKSPAELVANEVSVVCDPRNVLPLLDVK